MSTNTMTKLTDHADAGKLILRIGLGLTMVIQGVPKFMGGAEGLERVGSAMAMFGLDFFPVFWGFMAASSQVLGGVLIAIGFLYRPALALLVFTMFTATLVTLPEGNYLQNFNDFGYAFNLFLVFLGMLFIGPGRFALKS